MFIGGDNLGGWWFILWLNCLFRWISMDNLKETQKNPQSFVFGLTKTKMDNLGQKDIELVRNGSEILRLVGFFFFHH